MSLIPTAEEEKEMKKIAQILRGLSQKAHEKAVELTRQFSVLLMKLGEAEATGQPVEDLKAKMAGIEQKIHKLAALRNRARGATNEADEFWLKWLREKRRLTGEWKYDSSTEKLYELVGKLIREGGIKEDEGWWEEVLRLVDDHWVSHFSGPGVALRKAIEALRLAKFRLSLLGAESGVRLAKQRHWWGPPASAEWLDAPLPLQKQFLDEQEEERQWVRERALDKIRSAKYYLEGLSEGMLEDIIYNRLRDIVSGVSVELSDLSDNIKQARELLSYLELQMEKEKPDIEMVNEICGRLEMLLQPLQNRIRQVFKEVEGRVEEARKRIGLPFLGEDGLKRIAAILHSLSEVVNEVPKYAEELRKPKRKPRTPKVKPRWGWLP
jgi:hypothetical protein